MKFRLTLMSAVLCLSVVMAQPGLAQQLQPQEPELVQQMLADGWQKMADGVLQRGVGGSRVETFTYNQEGLRWMVQRMEERVSFLEQEYSKFPAEELARLIEGLKAEILAAEASLSAPQAETVGADEIQNCNISYGANAYADPLTGPSAQGVTASANANFSSTCGYVGHTFAQAYARATIGTTTTTKTQEDPRYNGTSLNSYAAASVSGNLDCHSYAYGRGWSDQLGIGYATEDTNYSCPPPPPPPPVASISGSSAQYTDDYTPCVNTTWYASASGGTPGYSYNWYVGSTYQGSGSSLTLQGCYNTSITVRLIAYDSAGQSDDEYYTTTWYYSPNDPCAYDPYAYGCSCYNGGGRYPYQEQRELCPYY